MPLETATYIDSLVVTNPDGALDDRSTADDHLRLIKATLKRTFPMINAAVSASAAHLINTKRTDVEHTISATASFLTLPQAVRLSEGMKVCYLPALSAKIDPSATVIAGWSSLSVSRCLTGMYIIHHGLGLFEQIGLVTPVDTNVFGIGNRRYASYTVLNGLQAKVRIHDESGNLADCGFNLLICVPPNFADW